jgi:hypothetical protein
MASNFSVSLRETARLYLRYMLVGLVGIPLALLYALAKRANLSASVVMAGLLMLGLVSAFFLWRRLGDWQVKPVVALNFDACWAELVNTTLQNGASLQQTLTIDDDRLPTWNRILAPAFAANADVERLETSWNYILEAQTRTAQSTETLQPFLVYRREPPRTQPKRHNGRPEPTRQGQPAWALALGGQMHNAHGLA